MAVIVWDRDDVLLDLTGAWLSYWKRANPGCAVSYRDLTRNPPDEVIGCTREEYLASLDAFRLSPEASALPPRREVLEWFRRYGDRHRHLVLSATPKTTAAAAAAWTFRHFGEWVRSFHIVPSHRAGDREEREREKADYLAWLGKGEILVDDSRENIDRASTRGVRGVLFPAPWNGASGSIADALDALTTIADGVPQ